MKIRSIVSLIAMLAITSCATTTSERQKARGEIDNMSKVALGELFKEKQSAQALFNKAKGYAVFRGTQTALMISGGGGKGVAIDKSSNKKTYMRMAAAGIGVGVGAQILTTVILFEDLKSYNDFVENGWDADASASAAAIEEGLNQDASFSKGVAVYQMTEAGLIAQASVKGTKYWADGDLNNMK